MSRRAKSAIETTLKRSAKSVKSRLPVDARRGQLLSLGLDLFGQRSYESISIDDIAAAAGISRGLLYHYFRNKRGFYVESIRFGAEQLRQRIADSAPDEGAGRGEPLEPRARVEEGLAAYLDYVAHFGGAYATLMRSGIGFDPEVSEILEQTRADIAAKMLEDLEGKLAANADLELVRIAARGWLGMVEFASLEWLERREVPRRALIDLLATALEHTLGAAGADL